MNFAGLPAIFESFAHTAAPVAVASLWQGMAIASALVLSLRITRRISAAQRFALWLTAFVAIAVLPLATLIVPASSRAIAAASIGANLSHAWQLDARWAFAIAILWLIASLARAADLVFHVARLRRLWRTAAPVETPATPNSARSFQVCSTQQVDRPSVIGFFAPRVLIPDWLLPRLTSAELNQIVLHESTHLVRRDDWTNLFQKLCLVLFPLNPALVWLDRQLAKERERACDEAVVRITQAPRAYAACLASLAERGLAYRKEALSLGAWRRRSELVDRVHRILRRNRLMHPALARVLLGSLGCGLLVVTIELARCPQLVDFVPTAAGATAFNNSPVQLGDAVYPTNPRRDTLTPGAHIVQARAIMPSASQTKPFASRAHTHELVKTAAEGELRASSEPGVSSRHPRALAAKYLTPEAGAPQFVVFTTWEQIETSTPANQAVVADYAAAGPTSVQAAENASTQSANASKQSNTPPDATQTPVQRRTTFTQLILRVAPVGDRSSYPAAIPIGNGWFVIQL